MNRILLLSLMAALFNALPLAAEPIWINVSLKAIVDPATGKVPACFVTNRIDQAFEQANIWLANNWRGYRLRVVDRYLPIGSTDTSGPSAWFNINLKYTNAYFKATAKADPRYAWNTNAVNIYINNGDYSSGGGDMIITAYEILRDEWHTNLFPYSVAGNWLHEVGHCFGLGHTFGSCDQYVAEACFRTNGYYVGWCGLPDILPEYAYFNRDLITLANFLNYYTNCTPAQQVLANNTWFNLMSYHQITNTAVLPPSQYSSQMNVITESQSDILSDAANSWQQAVVSGTTRYVSAFGLNLPGRGIASDKPLRTVTAGVAAADRAGTDIVLIGPGTYNEQPRLNTRVTLRATRDGPVTIGRN
ncbi:MAG TPA: hypothetical protein VJA21_14540 [Verrucomicrobiae bacterium]